MNTIIVGSSGFARETLEVMLQTRHQGEIYFYDDVNLSLGNIYDKYICLHDELSVKAIAAKNPTRFVLGTGNPQLRISLYNKFSSWGVEPSNIISMHAQVGLSNNKLGTAINIMTGVVITCGVVIGDGTLVNLNCTIGHDSIIGKFVELSPGVHLSGNCIIGDEVFVGTGAVVLPKVKVGSFSVVGAGSVITKDVPEGSTIVGVPGRVVKSVN